MTRKRFIKLCMGNLGYSRNKANEAATVAMKNSYEETYTLLCKMNNRYIESMSNALRKISESLVPVANAINTFVKAISAGVKAYTETMRAQRNYQNFWEEYSND